jgi:uncharacterized protein (TIGR02145 family)
MKISRIISGSMLAGVALSCAPVVQTVSYDFLTMDSVSISGRVVKESGSAVTQRGFCWGTNENPTVADHYTTDLFGPGSFTGKFGNLKYRTPYYFRAYAVNSHGTRYGNVIPVMMEIKQDPAKFIDKRDGKAYSTVKIGKQTWMAENLAWLPSVDSAESESIPDARYYVYGYNGTDVAAARRTQNYLTYGVLYNYAAAVTACPDGWHLPDNSEWIALTDFLVDNVGGKLKEPGLVHWQVSNDQVTNESAFTALPGGYRDYNYTLFSPADTVLYNKMQARKDSIVTASPKVGYPGEIKDTITRNYFRGNYMTGKKIVQGFKYLGAGAAFWASSPFKANQDYFGTNYRHLRANSNKIDQYIHSSNSSPGYSVRCLKN